VVPGGGRGYSWCAPAQHLPRITIGALLEGGSNMLDWIITTGGWVLFGLAVFFWVQWIERERELLANGKWHHLE
jgi:hypothetical protein